MTSTTSNHSEPLKKNTKPLPPVLKSKVASLALRNEPRVENSTLIRYVRQDETIIVIETENPLAKIGVKGQWLHVRTEGGTEGYVAAWFVERV
ncbi:MAG: SH3 domain-containing protein [Anaerolineae bacterium]|nr:SH3 domain-containing protein [Anaerolineae bacterium]